MPEIEITQPARYWNLHTEELIDQAASELWHDPMPVATQVFRDWGTGGMESMRLVVVGANQVHATAPLRTTLVRTTAGWEVLSDAEAASRGIPVPVTDEP